MSFNPITQAAFDSHLRGQKSGEIADDLTNADLFDLTFRETDLGGTTIALSRFPEARFDQSFELSGITWIGNELHRCHFVDVSLNKAEVLDCRLSWCAFIRVSLFRADLTGSSFEHCTLEELDFSRRCSLIRVTMRQCTLRNVKLGESLTIDEESGDFVFDEKGFLCRENGLLT